MALHARPLLQQRAAGFFSQNTAAASSRHLLVGSEARLGSCPDRNVAVIKQSPGAICCRQGLCHTRSTSLQLQKACSTPGASRQGPMSWAHGVAGSSLENGRARTMGAMKRGGWGSSRLGSISRRQQHVCRALKDDGGEEGGEEKKKPTSEGSDPKASSSSSSSSSSGEEGRDKKADGTSKSEYSIEELEPNELLQKLMEMFETDGQGNVYLEDVKVQNMSLELMRYISNEGMTTFFDADGNAVPDWTESRLETFISYRFGDAVSDQRVDWMMERELRDKVFASSPFDVGTAVELPNGGRCFVGKLRGTSEQAVEVLNARMKEVYPDYIIALGPEGSLDEDGQIVGPDAIPCFVYPKDGFISFIFLGWFFWPGLLFSLYWAKDSLYADPGVVSGIAAAWTATLYPLSVGLVLAAPILGQAIWAALNKLPQPRNYTPLAVPGLGLLSVASHLNYVTKDRQQYLDWSLFRTISSAAASIGLILASKNPISLPDGMFQSLAAFGFPEASGTLSGVVLVKADLLRHSALLTELLSQLSVTTFAGVDGDPVVAVSPFALAGLVGLNATAFSLLPLYGIPGGQILEAVLKDNDQTSSIAGFFALAAIINLFTNFSLPWLFFLMYLPVFSSQDILQYDMIKKPGVVQSSVGLGLIVAGVVTLLPQGVFEFLFQSGASPIAEQIVVSLGLA